MPRFEEGKDYIECSVSVESDGTRHWTRKGEAIFTVLSDGTKIDRRQKPPYLSIDPCPWCDAKGEHVSVVSSHVPTKHVDPRLGRKI